MSQEDTQHTIGKLHEEAYERDAIHFAVVPVTANESLKPGQHIGFTEGGYQVTAAPSLPYKHIGIVDPFLSKPLKKGDRFWMILYPNTITGLKHVWSHPSFSDDGRGVGSSSEKWLRDFARSVDADYHQMMYVASSHCEGDSKWGEYLIEGGEWEGQSTPDEFWDHFKNLTGKEPDKKYGLPRIFSCSC